MGARMTAPSLPPISFYDLMVPPGPVDVETCFVEYKLGPVDRTKDLLRDVGAGREMLGAAEKIGFRNLHGLKTLEGMEESCAKWRRWTGLQKVVGTVETARELLQADPEGKLVIFCVYHWTMEMIRMELAKQYDPIKLYPKARPGFRKRAIERFQLRKHRRVLLCAIKAVSEQPADFTVANRILFAETEWHIRRNAQATLCVHRRGQKNPVDVTFLGLSGTPDEGIASAMCGRVRNLVTTFDRGDL